MTISNSIKVYLQWWRTWKTLPVLSWIRAANLYREGRYQEAASFYSVGIRRHLHHPARISARLDLSYCLFKMKKVTEAERELSAVVAEFPEHREAYIRLARIQLWVGRCTEASLILQKGAELFEGDAEISALLLFALIDQRAPRQQIVEASNRAKRAGEITPGHKLLRVAQARSLWYLGDREGGRTRSQALALEEPALFEAVVTYAEILLEEKRIDEAMRHMRRALQVSPNHPRVLSLLARAYLFDSENYNPEFSQQVAITACQSSSWASPRDMHILAEAYLRTGDRLSALMTASRAKDIGAQSKREYAHEGTLDKLIEDLMSEPRT